MNRFNIAGYTTFTQDGLPDIWNAAYRDMRFSVPSAKTIQVSEGFEANLPALADIHLGDQNLWWVLLHFNGLHDAIHDIRIGTVLKIPDRNALITFLSANAQPTSTSRTVVI